MSACDQSTPHTRPRTDSDPDETSSPTPATHPQSASQPSARHPHPAAQATPAAEPAAADTPSQICHQQTQPPRSPTPTQTPTPPAPHEPKPTEHASKPLQHPQTATPWHQRPNPPISRERAGSYAGAKDGIAANDFVGAAYNHGLIAGLTVAADLSRANKPDNTHRARDDRQDQFERLLAGEAEETIFVEETFEPVAEKPAEKRKRQLPQPKSFPLPGATMPPPPEPSQP